MLRALRARSSTGFGGTGEAGEQWGARPRGGRSGRATAVAYCCQTAAGRALWSRKAQVCGDVVRAPSTAIGIAGIG
eukprot:2367448-Prymnesium_polylepis.1